MKEFLSVVTRKGQITIPAEIRAALDIKQGDKVALAVEEGSVRLSRTGSVVARTAGILRTNKPPLSAEELRKVAEESIAQEAVERSGG